VLDSKLDKIDLKVLEWYRNEKERSRVRDRKESIKNGGCEYIIKDGNT
jgi:hypothetical protein